MRMTIKEFAASRLVEEGTVRQYLRRHPEIVLVPGENGQFYIEEGTEAYVQLNEKYPQKTDRIEVITHHPEDEKRIHELEQALILAQASIQRLTESNKTLTDKIADGTTQAKLLIVQKDLQYSEEKLKNAVERAENAENEVRKYVKTWFGFYKKKG